MPGLARPKRLEEAKRTEMLAKSRLGESSELTQNTFA